VYEKRFETPLGACVARMETSVWLNVDRASLKPDVRMPCAEMAGLEDEIIRLAGRQIQCRSPKQLGEIL